MVANKLKNNLTFTFTVIFFGILTFSQLISSSADALSGSVEIYAGNTYPGAIDGPNGIARLSSPWGFAKSPSGKIYVLNTHTVSVIDSDRSIEVFAGSSRGDNDGSRQIANFNDLKFIAFDSSGDMYLSDSANHKIKKIAMDTGIVSTFAGSSAGFSDGQGILAQFNRPSGLAFDEDDNLYVADSRNRRIRKIDTLGNVTTIAAHTNSHSLDGDAFSVKIGNDLGDLEIHNGELYFVDTSYNSVRKLNLVNSTIATVAGTGVDGDVLGDALTTAQFRAPRAIAIDENSNVYITDDQTNKIYFLNATSNEVELFASSNDVGFRGVSQNRIFSK